MKSLKKITVLLIITLIGIGAYLTFAFAGSDIIPPHRSDEEERIIKTYKATNEGVVSISTVSVSYDPFDLNPVKEGQGSGIVVDARRGIVLTNLHVIKGSNQIKVVLANRKTYNASLLGIDKEYDIAVIQIQNSPSDLVALPFGDSSKLDVGQRVLAIGYPFQLDRTLTSGIISSLGRIVRNPDGTLMKGLIQTDAAINPGNSGGPLLDVEGRLIGITTAILSQSGDSAGIGFAVPINPVRQMLPELIATGKVLRPKMGWIVKDTDQGPLVWRVQKNGPAEKAGIEPLYRKVESGFMTGYVMDLERADFISGVNGKPVQTKDEIEDLVQATNGERSLIFSVRRGGMDGKERTVEIKPVLR